MHPPETFYSILLDGPLPLSAAAKAKLDGQFEGKGAAAFGVREDEQANVNADTSNRQAFEGWLLSPWLQARSSSCAGVNISSERSSRSQAHSSDLRSPTLPVQWFVR
jgi:hypothetical protein